MRKPTPHPTLSGRDYSAADVFEVERERILHRHWYYAGRAELVEEPGQCLVVDVADESILVVRGRDDALHAHFNVCRHRGARLCDEGETRLKGAIKCPYHAWSYAHDGRLIGTPNVAADEVDRDALSLWPAAADVWEGFLFVCLAPEPPALRDWLADQLDPPLRFERFGLGELRTGHRTVTEVAANWKVLVENYNECLHCPTVHPELVQIVPLYRTGAVVAPDRPDGVAMAAGATSFTRSGSSPLPLLPRLDACDAASYFGGVVFPNMFIDVTGTSAMATTLHPRGPAATTVVTEYLFAPETIAADGFDPGEIVAFTELVARQDYDVCERVQRGVSSRAFSHGVLAAKDLSLIHISEPTRPY